MVVLHLHTDFVAQERAVSLIRGDSSESVLLRQKRMARKWPDPDLYDRRSVCGSELKNGIRQFCIALIESRMWNRLITAAILISVSILPLDDPFKSSWEQFNKNSTDNSDLTARMIGKINLAQSILFITDVVVKIVAQGFFMGGRAYMRPSLIHI